ncbi:MAG: DUF2335 domain-containing protein [Gilliamella sp.]|nr:DUF2335 domain-containing protein [Gilliamella sp.]MCO6555057.1 DUF2335 domain-containing protein [Gilliamella sp.]
MSKNTKAMSHKSSGHNVKGLSIAKQTVTATHREGPIPDSNEMAAYENIHEGFADRILVMAEENGKHRREIEKIALEADATNKKAVIENDRISIKSFNIGRLVGAFVSLVAISGAIYLGANDGSEVTAVALVALPVASIIQAIIGNNKKNKNDES